MIFCACSLLLFFARSALTLLTRGLRLCIHILPRGAHCLAQHLHVANVVSQQQDQAGIDEGALLIGQATMQLDQCLVKVVRREEIEVGLQLCHAANSGLREPIARATASRTARMSSRCQRAATCWSGRTR